MKIFRTQNVYNAALDRIRYLFAEFPTIVVGFSGGKDSTVCLHLCLQVARELNRLPLRVMWIDQEVEWQGTVDFTTDVMTMPEVQPMWFQIPMVITNNASSFERYNYCWREADREQWVHPQHPLSIKENRYGTTRFHELFVAIFAVELREHRACYIAGVRTEEAPKRFVALTSAATYKWITWGRVETKALGHYAFYPIYDWSYRDVWKAIHDNAWPYNRVYDEFYRHGIPPFRMRISNLHHETAIQNLLLVQTIEPETWLRVAARIAGANTIKHLKTRAFRCPRKLPFMFPTWEAYLEHLLTNIVQEESRRQAVRKKTAKLMEVYVHPDIREALCRVLISTILSSDWDWTQLQNFTYNPAVRVYERWRKGRLAGIPGKSCRQYFPPGAVDAIAARLREAAHA